MLQFYNGSWIEIDAPIGVDPTWNASDCSMYSACMAALLSRSIPASSAAPIAEAYVYSLRYPGMRFNEELERAIAWVRGTF